MSKLEVILVSEFIKELEFIVRQTNANSKGKIVMFDILKQVYLKSVRRHLMLDIPEDCLCCNIDKQIELLSNVLEELIPHGTRKGIIINHILKCFKS